MAAPAGAAGKRLAVSLLFLANGYLVGNWAPKIPEFAARLSLDESGLGWMIAAFGLGSILTMPAIGVLISKIGSAPVVRVTALMTVPTLLIITLAPNAWVAAIVVFGFGGLISAMDVAMNANAVDVERIRGRAIMSSCHGFWSLGGLIGAFTGGYAIELGGVMGQAWLSVFVAGALVIAGLRALHRDQPVAAVDRPPLRFPATPMPYLIGIVALFSAIPEGSVLDWGALYLRQERGADVVMSSLGYGAFSATMALVRFAGDPVRDRFGAVRTIQVCAIIAAIGMFVSGQSSDPIMVIAGFAIAGIGIANMVPIAFSAGGNVPGLAPGIGLSVVTTIGYSGILAAPALIGFIAEHTGFALIFSCLSLVVLAVLPLSGLTRYADRQS